jgi:hypothetical protein
LSVAKRSHDNASLEAKGNSIMTGGHAGSQSKPVCGCCGNFDFGPIFRFTVGMRIFGRRLEWWGWGGRLGELGGFG